jgi:hypothetical protein
MPPTASRKPEALEHCSKVAGEQGSMCWWLPAGRSGGPFARGHFGRVFSPIHSSSSFNFCELYFYAMETVADIEERERQVSHEG